MLDDTHKLAIETINLGKQALIFVPSRASAEKTAEEISKLTTISLHDLEQEVLKVITFPTKQCRRLSHCVKKGIAFHHSGLTSPQKEILEREFRAGRIKIICCTPTLAAGLSLPVYRVIIKSLRRFSEKSGMDWIPVLEYLQMAGRAGRPEYEKLGEAIVITKTESEKEEIYSRYILGEPEDIYSKLAVEPVLRTYLLSLISSRIIRDEESMSKFFLQTFWAHQFQDLPRLTSIINRMLKLLSEWQFVTVSGDDNISNQDKNSLASSNGPDFVSASSLNKPLGMKVQPTAIGKRISELYLDPLTARHLLDCLNQLSNQNKDPETPENLTKPNNNSSQITSASDSFPLLQMISHTLEMRPLLRTKSKEQDSIQEELTKNYSILLEHEPNVYDLEYPEFIDSIKTALFFCGWINEIGEDYLLDKYDIRPGEIKVKLEIADGSLYYTEELAQLTFRRGNITQISQLRLRIKYGVKEELLPLLKLKGVGRIRARKMFNQGIKDLGDLKKVDPANLSQIVGRNVAAGIKKQIGDEVKEIPKGTRKGQLSLSKY